VPQSRLHLRNHDHGHHVLLALLRRGRRERLLGRPGLGRLPHPGHSFLVRCARSHVLRHHGWPCAHVCDVHLAQDPEPLGFRI
ncbi:MAG: hypothetical protein ACK56I_20270, partial [bacterium]